MNMMLGSHFHDVLVFFMKKQSDARLAPNRVGHDVSRLRLARVNFFHRQVNSYRLLERRRSTTAISAIQEIPTEFILIRGMLVKTAAAAKEPRRKFLPSRPELSSQYYSIN
jgi:hypothetical protein